jgi:ABC-type Fe3+-hydroxamate transport system substrate-binding protein
MDDQNRYVDRVRLPSPLSSPPRRVVSLVPSLTESLFDLNLGDRVVAITDYCIHPADRLAGLPRVGGTKTPDIARIIALHPDLVLMNREENRREDAEQLEAAGIHVWASEPRTVQEALNQLWELMDIFDEPAMSERVRWIERQMDWTAATARQQRPVRVFAPIWYDPWIVFTGDTFCNDLLRICGGENVFANFVQGEPDIALDQHRPARSAAAAGRYPEVTPDEIIQRQPEVVLLPNEPYPFAEAHTAELAKLEIPAARTGRIHRIDGTLLTWHGTRIAYALAELPSLLVSVEEEDCDR